MKKIFPTVLFLGLLLWGAHPVQGLCVIEPNASLHSGPGWDHPKTSWALKSYTPLRKLDTWNDWYEVSDLDGDTHWVHSGVVIDHQYCVTIKTEQTFLREGPGHHYPEITMGSKYEVFRYIRRSGKWLQVANIDGEGFWLLQKHAWVQ